VILGNIQILITYAVELAAIIGREARDVPASKAMDYVDGRKHVQI
jgi:2-keto-4-pentenoate hydratase/2-oxohepta-3-ene-1,7-dioic acid hydratase in catechol pathway